MQTYFLHGHAPGKKFFSAHKRADFGNKIRALQGAEISNQMLAFGWRDCQKYFFDSLSGRFPALFCICFI